MPYSEKEHKVSNTNYLNKDFNSFKASLINYAKTYFPNTYKDFNETSPGMMLIEMGAYVGDVLSFYIDQQYREMLLPLAEERRNIVNLAKMVGYKVKPIYPSFVELTFSQTVVSETSDLTNIQPEYKNGLVIEPGAQITSTTDSDLVFETLDYVDFKTSGSAYLTDTDDPSNINNSSGLIDEWTLKRTVKAVSGETKTYTFDVGSPQKFLELNLPDTNVVEILKVEDSNGNKWYEVDYLAQEKIPIIKHYRETDRTNAYTMADDSITSIPVPYSLEYIKTNKRFITETNDDNTTSLIFGNGLLRSGQKLTSTILQLQQVGIQVPGNPQDLVDSYDTLLGDDFATLGESPSQVTLTVTYRVGGGMSANVSTKDLSTISSYTSDISLPGTSTLSVTNNMPARGGASSETIEEIRQRAMAHFTTQNRIVTKEDYEARVMTMSAQYGKLSKVYVERGSENIYRVPGTEAVIDQSALDTALFEIQQQNSSYQLVDEDGNINTTALTDLYNIVTGGGGIDTGYSTNLVEGTEARITSPINIHILSYDGNKNLVGDPEPLPSLLVQNLKNYLSQYRIISDEVVIYPGKIINFGVVFDVIAHKTANKSEVKLKCIQTIRNYFRVDKMQFSQPIHTTDIEYELMNIDGVRSINFVELTQYMTTDGEVRFANPLHYLSYDVSGDSDFDPTTPSWTTSNTGTQGYGYFYNFNQFYNGDTSADGVIYPSVQPAVFELKNSGQNVIGRIR